MFFYLSKIFWFFIQPLNLAIFLLLAGLLAALLGRRRLFATGSVLAFLILALAAWSSLGAMLLGPLEERFPGRRCRKRSTASSCLAVASRAPSTWCAAAMS